MSCKREGELAKALVAGHWPNGCSEELRGHVAGCSVCRSRVVLAQAFRRERAIACGQPRLESPGVLWWRAQLRRRNAALERISRPALGAQVFAVTVALIGAAIFLASQAKNTLGWLSWLRDLPRALHLEALLPAGLQNPMGGLLLGVALLALVAGLGGFAAYVSSDRN
ncbi:MAG TPA: hypothetical protein VHA37_01055 [Candidatus Saccharimonadales bacterium]|nr:hypothetical protein [Candidatus Saccharimonadales bacterium]